MRPHVTSLRQICNRRAALVGGLTMCAAAMALPSALLSQAAQIYYLTPDVAYEAAQTGKIILIDIRRPEEWLETGVAEGAIGLDMTDDSFVQSLIALRRANPDTPLALICRTGNRTTRVTQTLAEQGFPGLVNIAEGMAGGPNGAGWLKRGLPIYAGTPQNVRTRTQAAMPQR